MKWYVLQFTATRFTAVFSHLERLNFSYYCPMVTERYRRPDKEISYRERLIPLFHGYLFINADFDKIHSSAITAIPYVQRFIAFGGEPLPVPEEEIYNVQKGERNQLILSDSPRLVEIMLMDDPRKRSIAMLNYITEKSLTHKMKRKKNDCYQKKASKQAQATT
ncbi:transcription termination/antitermination NusG family protein [Yersinia enterocolitica]|uniref:transcription termination/antitermination NusG family protein n=1 Tax=Yersiniaceae TaxID=1903411 RepID=UPI001B241ABC|nr:transcription termination/antitermination NusG family protein [Yersinia intermedia]EKN3891445.1 transcription termination factor NusG [Yersinia enterocolitica]HBA4338124.1 transcription termination factor NusG [Escherichia coli]HBE9082565.1 transcription termination factor NusG [Serratia fonticola]EKN3944450.1 transcription termination factor NusG [Yersinia enterocolitica]EKN4176327.1 transcription termination factor NusG [Yersinia enterocolitica]